MAYRHGIRIQENPTSISTPVKNESGVTVIFGTAPVNLSKDPSKAANRLFLCSTFAEAKEAVGYSGDYENYTLCQAMDVFFKVYKVAPVIICNVLDPSVHTAAYTEILTVENGVAVSEKHGILLDNLKVQSGDAELVSDSDYTADFDDEGRLVVTVLKEGVSALNLTGNMLAPEKVTTSNVIGSYDAGTGIETGIELVRKVYPVFGLAPGLLIAPGWSHKPEVGLALAEKSRNINGAFRCENVIDIDTEKASKYTDAASVKKECGFTSEHTIAVWPMVQCGGKMVYYSAVYAAMTCYTDYENDSVPSLSPSNKKLKISAAVLKDGTEVNLDILQANELNAEGVATVLNQNGFRSWGNNTAAYLEKTDPKDRWICCRRFFSWWGNSFIVNYMEKVDDPTNYRLIESIVDSENVRGNSLVSQGKCAGIRMVYNYEENKKEDVMNGKIVFRQYLAPFTPAEDILNVLEFDPSMIEAALGGGE